MVDSLVTRLHGRPMQAGLHTNLTTVDSISDHRICIHHSTYTYYHKAEVPGGMPQSKMFQHRSTVKAPR